MDRAKAEFLFGTATPDVDIGDDDDLMRYFSAAIADEYAEDAEFHSVLPVMLTVLTNQIFGDSPPETWQTAQRMLGLGLPREEAVGQLAATMASVLRATMEAGTEEGFDGSALLIRRLETLPTPRGFEIVEALAGVVSRDQGLDPEDAREGALELLDRVDDPVTDDLVHGCIDNYTAEDTAFLLLPLDRLVHLPTLTDDVVLTHRLEPDEVRRGALRVSSFDLAVHDYYREPLVLPTGESVEFDFDDRDSWWRGPAGWLDGLTPGDLVAVRADPRGVVTLDRQTTPPEASDRQTDAIRAGFDAAVLGDLPATAKELAAATLLAYPSRFAEPALPLSELCAAAGLDIRGTFVADGDHRWAELARKQRVLRVDDQYADDEDRADQILDLIEIVENSDSPDDALRDALRDLADDVWDSIVVVDELIAASEAPETVRAVCRRLTSAARRPVEQRMAHWMAALVEEQAGDVLAAETHVGAAFEADASWGPLIDRRAWYASDRGDALTAARLWDQLVHPNPEMLDALERFASVGGRRLGRNEPCWCGSGRKYKACHLGSAEPGPLAARVDWLFQKGATFVARCGDEARMDLIELAMASGMDPDEMAEDTTTADDPFLVDVALTELGWFEHFLAQRGPLLPDDESELGGQWLGVQRTVYETAGIDQAGTLSLRDLRSDERIDVHDPELASVLAVGDRLLARAVPDGQGRQFVGFPLRIPRDKEAEVLAACAGPDALALCTAVKDLLIRLESGTPRRRPNVGRHGRYRGPRRRGPHH